LAEYLEKKGALTADRKRASTRKRPKPEKGGVMAEVTEIKATCKACGHVWHYLPSDALASAGQQLQQLGMSLTPGCCCCTGFMQQPQPIDKCPKCSSRAVTTEKVTRIV
jgi:hypothetical protein